MSQTLRDATTAAPPDLETLAELVGMLGDAVASMRTDIASLRAQLAEKQVAGMRYRGVFEDGAQYKTDDVVSDHGSMWICVRDTITRPSHELGAWKVCVRKGKDGKEGLSYPQVLKEIEKALDKFKREELR